jgi:hypothetical protein
VTSQELGQDEERGVSFDDIPVSSVIYMGRGSFRMEAVALDRTPAPEEAGIVQPVTSVVTAPMHAPARDPEGGRPRLRSLFGSQVDVPVLAAPTGSVGLRAPAVTLSRATLATVVGLVLVCGVVVGTAARHLLAAPAPLAVVSAAPTVPAPVLSAAAQAAPAPVAANVPTVDTAPPSPPPLVAVPAPVTIRAHAKTATRQTAEHNASPATESEAEPATTPSTKPPGKASGNPSGKTWVDPWAS